MESNLQNKDYKTIFEKFDNITSELECAEDL